MLVFQQNVSIERHEFPGGLSALVFESYETKADRPFVFVLHGLGSRKERHLDLCLRLVGAGYRACVLDAPGHGERWHKDYSGLFADYMDPAFLRTFGSVVAGTAEEVAQLATEFGLSEFGVIGHSMGGFTAMHVALADPRARVVVNISGSINLAAIPHEFVESGDFSDLIRAADPALRARELVPRPVLLLHGEVDEVVPIAGAHRLYTALAENYVANRENISLVELPGVGHEFTREMAERAVDWIRHFLPQKEECNA